MSLRYIGHVKLGGKMNLSGNEKGYSSFGEKTAGEQSAGLISEVKM